MPLTSAEVRDKIKEEFNRKIDKALEINSPADGLPIWKPLFFILDMYNTGSFYGTFELKIEAAKVREPIISKQTVKTDGIYDDEKIK